MKLLAILLSGIAWLNGNFSTYDTIQKNIFSYAESGYREVKSSRELADHLQQNGFTIEWGCGDIPTAFVATFGSGSPVIGLLAEYDALKGMSQDTVAYKKPVVEGGCGHACGHNLLGTASCAAAVAISKWLAQGHKGTVKFFGCPAEEGGGGKYYMTRSGCFDACDVMFDWHPGDVNEVSLAPWAAVYRVNFTFKGVSAHAGGEPWNGRSALDAVEAFDMMMNMMREHVRPECRIHYIIADGGKAPNVVPESAKVIYYFRAPKIPEARDVMERAVKAAEGAAMGTGTTMSYEIINASYEKLINHTFADVLQRNLKAAGPMKFDARELKFLEDIYRQAGAKFDMSKYYEIPDEPTTENIAYSTDVGNVSQMVPLATFRIALNPYGVASDHSWQMAAIAGTTIGTKCLLKAAEVFYRSAIELYKSPATLARIREEFVSVRGENCKFEPIMDRKPPIDSF